MQTRGQNRLDNKQQNDEDVRHYIERLMDEENSDRAQPYIDQLMNNQNHSKIQDHDGQSYELMNNSDGGTGESGKSVDVLFNSCNQSIRKEGRNLSSFLGIIVRTPELTPLHINDWRNFDYEEKKKLLNFMRDKINEKMQNSERPNDQSPHSVSCEGDVYSQVFGNEKSGYVRGLRLGPTPSVLWGRRSFLENIVIEDSSNEIVQRLEQKII
ncbi:hypothetical protein FXO37_02982 [Capsicum annuum]|nr:hypothetical protein FXO37_02982 [Capsicum annuum]